MCIENKKCPAWVSLESMGILSQGCLLDAFWVSSLLVPIYQSTHHPTFYVDLPHKKLVCVQNVSFGAFGFIDFGYLETAVKQEEVYIKRPILAGGSLLYEACIQKLVHECLSSHGFPTGAPRPMYLFRLQNQSIGFAMELIQGAVTLDAYLESVSSSSLSSIIIECLFQLSSMVWHLHYELGMNHRDLKPSNFLIVKRDAPVRIILTIENDRLEIESRYSLTFIDFGFSCLGSMSTQESALSLSTVYPRSDPCPKEGRDMYLFLAFLYIDYHTKLPPTLLRLFEQWLDIPGSNFCGFMRRDKEHSKKWLYFITGNEQVTSFQSCPCRVVRDLRTFMDSQAS